MTIPELNWPTDPNAYGILADGADTGHVAVQLADGTIRTERRSGGLTVDDMLRDPRRIARRLHEEAELQMIARTWLPGDFDPRQLRRRTGRALRRYRGAHRTGAWTVAALADEIAVMDRDRRIAHRRSLRRDKSDGSPVYLGTRWTQLRFYEPGHPFEGTLTIDVPEGPPGPGIIAVDEADTGPLVWQPAVAALADMFEPWPSLAGLA